MSDQKVIIKVANNPQEVPVGIATDTAIQQLAANCRLSNFTLRLDGEDIEEGQKLPAKLTMEMSERLELVPYDKAA